MSRARLVVDRLRRLGSHRVRFGSEDRGQASTLFIVLAAIGILFLTGTFLLPLGEAADKRSSAQIAADAAALAGAEAAADATANRLRDGFTWQPTAGPDLFRCGAYDSQAATFAKQNGATLDHPRSCINGKVSVTVELDERATGGRIATASAVAAVGLQVPCTWDIDTPPPTTTTTTTKPTTTTTGPAPTTTTKPPPDVDARLICGSLVIDYVRDGVTHKLVFDDDYTTVRKAIRPRLID